MGPLQGSQSIFFAEYGHVAYQIKGNEAYNNMLAIVLPLHISFSPFLKVAMLHVKVTGMREERAGCFAFVFLLSRDGLVALPRGAMGLSAVLI